MKLVTFRYEGNERIGSVVGDKVVDLNYACQLWLQSLGKYRYERIAEAYVPSDMVGFLQGGSESLQMAQTSAEFVLNEQTDVFGWKVVHSISDVRTEAPVKRPGKIICVGHNYREHILEMGREIPQYPVIFAKYANTVIGPEDDIPYPEITEQLDYEAEFAFVIGRKAQRVKQEHALEYVAGYTIVNDVTSRDIQRRTIQWHQGKTVDGSAPMGPWLITKDELIDPHKSEIELRVNGELRQKSNTANLVFNVHFLVEFLSHIMTLEPGDVICTGTPGGVGAAMKPPQFLQDEDVVRIDLAGIGKLENRVKK